MSHLHFPDFSRAKSSITSLMEATEQEGIKGALKGGLGVAGAVATTAAVAGYALTPLGWATFGTIGAVSGGSGLLKWAKNKLS